MMAGWEGGMLLWLLGALLSRNVLANGCSRQDEPCGHRIRQLPGTEVSLSNWSHFSGYLKIPGDIEVFYQFTKHPDLTRPLIVWMSGGPGASSLMGLFGELGPFLLNGQSLPTATADGGWKLFSNPHGWHKEASLLAWEQPAGVGFSRCLREPCPVWDDDSSALANLHVLLAFFDAYPGESKRALFITGESYAGIYVPLLAQNVHDHNTKQQQAANRIRLRGIAVGNGCVGYATSGSCGKDSLDVFISYLERSAPGVDRSALTNSRAACGSELSRGFQAAKEFSPQCRSALANLFEELGQFNVYHWSSPCGPEEQGNWGDGSAFSCGSESAQQKYFNTPEVQRDIHAIGDSDVKPKSWQMWDGDWPGYNISRPDVISVYAQLLKSGYDVLIYNGLRDSAVSIVGAEEWTVRLPCAIETARRKWADSAGRFSGHVTQYVGPKSSLGVSGRLTFATVEGAGHVVPADRPIAARTMIGAFVGGLPLPDYRGAKCERYWLGRGYGSFCETGSVDAGATAAEDDALPTVI
mmetsp:Transcript_65728/g.140612  ORF Transcript_65728/g.140612 Transcript_65728/m.140612 type:complete len:525 (-) Transcript_65728:24-1598(-)